MFHLLRNAPRAPKATLRSFLFLLVILVSFGAMAQTQLDPVVVTGTREPQPLSRSSADIVFIDAQTIRNTTADSLEDLLRREAGVQIVRNGGPGQSSGYLIRGSSTSGTVVLVDGVRVGSASLGQADFEALSLAQIDHIEVLRGPASSLYGADAVGGVVQVFTRRGDGSPHVSGGAAIGGYHSRQGDLGVSGAEGAFDYAATIGRETSRGVSAIRPGDQFGLFNPDDDGYSRSFGNLRLGYTPAPGHRVGLTLLETKLDVQYDSAEFDAAFNPDPSPDFRNHLTTKLAALDYRGAISSAWTTTVQLAHSVDDATSGGRSISRIATHRDQATWQNAVRLGADQQLVVAVEHLRESVGGDVLAGEPKRSNNAIVVGYSGELGGNGLLADLRHDDNSAYGANTTGRVGWSREVVPGLRLRALAGTTFRAPTFNDLYFPFFGVATIKPERGRSVEIGAAWQSGSTSASATLYRNRVRDLIGFDPDPNMTDCPPGFFGCAANTARARLQGATLAAAQRWGGLDLRATVDLLDATDADTGVRLARRAAHQETLAADYAAGAWSVGASILDVGSRPDAGVVLGGYALVDLRATWRFLPQWRLEAKLLNALDHRVEPLRDYQGLGRQAWLGVRFDGRGL
jgi:vitamin B12 transporter